MTAHPYLHRRFVITVIALFSLLPAGCGGLLSDAPKRQLYRVNPTLSFPAALPHVAAQLLVATPTAPAGIDSRRIALSRSPVSLDYFADAEWTDRVPFLVQTALLDGFEKSAAIPAVGPDRGGLRADFILDTAIGDFTAIYDSPNGPPRIVVRLDTTLVRMPERRIVSRHSVRREERAAADAVPDIVQAFERALGGAVEEIVVSTLGNPALSEGHGSATSRTHFIRPGGVKAP
jgi:cholesterol transport system auxiliary component